MFIKCAACKKDIHKLSGRSKVIETPEEAARLREYHGLPQLDVGDTLCDNCRKVRSDRVSKHRRSVSEEGAVGGIPEEESPPETVGGGSQSSTSSSDFEMALPEQDKVEMRIARTVSSHARCLVCSETERLHVVTFSERCRVIDEANIFIPEGSRTCFAHKIENIENIQTLPIFSEYSLLSLDELKDLYRGTSNDMLYELVGRASLSEFQFKNLTGFSKDEFLEIQHRLNTLRASKSRNMSQALFIFLYKLRTGNSNDVIACMLNQRNGQFVSRCFTSVLSAFERDVLQDFGPASLTRETLLENTTTTAKRLLTLGEDQLALVLDGTYVRHQKSSNNAYQRRSYSGQKKQPLCKPFTVCTTNGLIVDFAGPFSGRENDATIVKQVLRDPNLIALLKPNDVLVVDRGFRDAVQHMSDLGFKVVMPAMKGKRKQLPCEEANFSRLVTKIRWIVEAVHGRVAQRYKMLHHTVDNRFLKEIRSLCRVVGYLENRYGQRSWGDSRMSAEIIDHMERRMTLTNDLGHLVLSEKWDRRPSAHQKVSSTELTDFPMLTRDQMLLLTSGPYQLNLALSYLAESMDAENKVDMTFVKEAPSIVRLEIRSRHRERTSYRVYIDYEAGKNQVDGIRRYWCQCPNGSRTVGCCSHVAAAVYYLAHARHLPSVLRPAAELTDLFVPSEGETGSEESDVDG